MKFETGGRLFLLNFAIGLGTFIQILDTSIANVAIPYIAGNLSVSADEGTWVITSFAASNAIVLPLTGWLADYFGRIKLFVWSVLLFALTSFLCALSTSLPMLVFFRIAQGAVAGSLIPLSQSLIVTHNPEETQGSAMGFWATIVIVAPILGPIIGGYLTDVYSWPWIFYINVPIGIFSAFTVYALLKNKESPIVRNPVDWTGLGFLALGVGCLQIMLDKGKDLDWFESNAILALTIVSVISITYFIIWTIYQKFPIIDFSFFRNRNFTLGTIAITIGYLIYFSSTVTLPLWLQTEQGYTAFWAGIAVAPIGLAPFLLSTVVGKHLNLFDLRAVSATSFFLFSMSLFYQSNFTTDVSLEHIMLTRFLQGFGVSIFFLPLVQLALGEISKDRYASASGLFNFIRILVASGFGTSLSIELWTYLEITHHGHLSEALTESRNEVVEYFKGMKESGIGYEVATGILDKMVEKQAFLLSTNDLSWLGGWLFLAMIPFVYLCKRVKIGANPKVVAE